MYDIASLQAQLAQLQTSLNVAPVPVVPAPIASPSVTTPIGATRDEIRNIVMEVLREEFSPKPRNPLLASIGKALTEDEQIFLTNHIGSVEKELPKFLESEDGKLAIQSFLFYLKGIYGN